MTNGEAREMARGLVRGSIIEDAASQFIALVLKETHDSRIKPLRAKVEALAAKLAEVEAERDDARKLQAKDFELLDSPWKQRAERAEAALDDSNASVIAFCAPVAVQYARGMGLPDGHLHPTHYDILEKAGARMDSFTRAAQKGEG